MPSIATPPPIPARRARRRQPAGRAPRLVLASAATERRFVFIIQRGAADGLDTVVPYAEPAYARLRGALAIDAAARRGWTALFALHPALVETAKLYAAKRGAVRPCRRFALPRPLALRRPERAGDRRHRALPGQGRLAEPPGRPAAASGSGEAIAIAPTVPLALRGAGGGDLVCAFGACRRRSDDLLLRVQQLYAARRAAARAVVGGDGRARHGRPARRRARARRELGPHWPPASSRSPTARASR